MILNTIYNNIDMIYKDMRMTKDNVDMTRYRDDMIKEEYNRIQYQKLDIMILNTRQNDIEMMREKEGKESYVVLYDNVLCCVWGKE